MQAKLLRVLESGDIRRVGDNQTFHVDVRVVCATHRDVESMVESGAFREDLMFRINAFEIHVPRIARNEWKTCYLWLGICTCDIVPNTRTSKQFSPMRPSRFSNSILGQETYENWLMWWNMQRSFATSRPSCRSTCLVISSTSESKREVKAMTTAANPMSLREMEYLGSARGDPATSRKQTQLPRKNSVSALRLFTTS